MADVKVKILKIEPGKGAVISLFDQRVQAGFPSPVQAVAPDTIDLTAELVNDPSSTFCARVIGDSMIGEGINEGDLLIIDRQLEPHDGCIAVCSIDGDFTVKRLQINTDGIYLRPANRRYRPIKVSTLSDFIIWGVVSHIIHRL